MGTGLGREQNSRGWDGDDSDGGGRGIDGDKVMVTGRDGEKKLSPCSSLE